MSMQHVVTYYEGKTQEILRRYGPGPRVHYHTGLIDQPKPWIGISDLRAQLIASQEQMLKYAAQVWDLKHIAFRNILDVGCGLGGGAIFWAQEFGAHVTAVTIAPSHVAIVARLAVQAGVRSRVRPLLCDASKVPGKHCFDAVLAIDSSSSFPRNPWFSCAVRLLRHGGRVFVYDCFLQNPEYAPAFNAHWCAQIGTIEEYLIAARAVGLQAETFDDVSTSAAHFWTATLGLMQEEAREKTMTDNQAQKLQRSIQVHTLVKNGVLDGGLRHILMSFVKN